MKPSAMPEVTKMPSSSEPECSSVYSELDFDQRELANAMSQAYEELIGFVSTPAFKTLYVQLMDLPSCERPEFVASVLLCPEELKKRAVQVPEGILIQTSAFGDRRPTLFAVKKFLPEKYHGVWENVNLTFDNQYKDGDISRDPDSCWRRPLPVALQNAMLASNVDLETAPNEFGVDTDRLFAPATKD